MNIERRQTAYEWFERQTELPLLVLSIAMIPLIFVPLLMEIPKSVGVTILSVDWFIWSVFALELCIKTYLAPDRRRHLITHWYEIPIVALPFLRPLRVVRSARALRALRASRIFAFASDATATSRELLRRHGLQYAIMLGVAMFFGCAAIVMVFERDGGGNITDFGTALWWAAATVTTVGYGDKFPVTPEGRGVAVLLMCVGAALFSLITANIAAFLISADRDETESSALDEVMQQLRKLEDQIAQLRMDRASVGSPGPTVARAEPD